MNTNANFTTGNWRRVGHSWVCSDRGIVASVVKHPDSQMKWATEAADLETEANRKLIAAAPDMYWALRNIINDGVNDETLERAMLAFIKAAEGKEVLTKAA